MNLTGGDIYPHYIKVTPLYYTHPPSLALPRIYFSTILPTHLWMNMTKRSKIDHDCVYKLIAQVILAASTDTIFRKFISNDL